MKLVPSPINESTSVSQAKVSRRFFAALIDVLFASILFFLLYTTVVDMAFNAAVNMDQLRLEYKDLSVQSYLYGIEEETVDLPLEEKVLVYLDSKDYPEAIYHYYVDFKQTVSETHTTPEAWYIANILNVGKEDSLFVLDPIPPVEPLRSSEITSEANSESTSITDPHEGYGFVPSGVVIKSDTSVAMLKSFYQSAYMTAETDFNSGEIQRQLNQYILFELVISIVIATSIFFLLIPTFLPNGQTLGKKIFHLGVTDLSGYKVKYWQLFVRYFATLSLEILLSFITSFLALFVSFTIAMFSKKARALHDFVSRTRVVDLRDSTIYVDAIEEAKHRAPKEGEVSTINEENFEDRFNHGA